MNEKSEEKCRKVFEKISNIIASSELTDDELFILFTRIEERSKAVIENLQAIKIKELNNETT